MNDYDASTYCDGIAEVYDEPGGESIQVGIGDYADLDLADRFSLVFG